MSKKKKKEQKEHTCSECWWYDPKEKWCIEGGIKVNQTELEPNTPACRRFDD